MNDRIEPRELNDRKAGGNRFVSRRQCGMHRLTKLAMFFPAIRLRRAAWTVNTVQRATSCRRMNVRGLRSAGNADEQKTERGDALQP